MSNPYIQTTPAQLAEMLQKCGAASIDEIFADQVPPQFQYRKSFDLPPALSELEIQREDAR